jgi:hypothetical protein
MIHQPPRQGRMDRIAKIRRLTKYPQIPASLISPWDKLNLISIIHTWTETKVPIQTRLKSYWIWIFDTQTLPD